MLKNSNFAAQAFAFALALAVSVGTFGVTVAPQIDSNAADVSVDVPMEKIA